MAIHKTMAAAAVALLTILGGGCNVASTGSSSSSRSGGGAAKFAVAAVSGASVARLVVTISAGDGPAFAPIVAALSPSPTGWSGFITGIPAGVGRQFDVVASDAAGATLMTGSGKVEIVAGGVASITIVLGSGGAGTGFENSVPVIDYVAVSQIQVRPGDKVRLGVSAHDPDPADANGLTYAWSSACGSFDSSSATSVIWTAPAVQGGCQLSVRVTDPRGASLTSYVKVDVQVLTGDVLVDVLLGLNSAPSIAGIKVDARFDTTLSGDLVVTAVDADGDVVSYAWTSDCSTLTFDTSAPYSASAPHFTSTDVSRSCVITVAVTDPPARGGRTTGVIVLPPGKGFNVAPVITRTTQPSVDLADPLLAEKVTAGEAVALAAYATDPEGAALTFTWTASAGTVDGQTDVTASPGSSAVVFHAPSPLAADMTVTVTVKDPLGESNSHLFRFKASGASSPCATLADGAACDDGNACTTGDTCHSGLCVGGTPTVCAAPDQCHLAGTCDTATGVCSNPAKPDGSTCSDGQGCTSGDVCAAGACLGSAVVCAAQDQCHLAGTCDPAAGACSNPVKPDGTACSDGSACTQTDACQAGACVGTNPVSCASGTTCNVATGLCEGGTIDRCAGKPACTAKDACHEAGTCDPATGLCSDPVSPDTKACDDGRACTTADHCAAGTCTGTAVACTTGTCQEPAGTCSSPTVVDPVASLLLDEGTSMGSALGLAYDETGVIYQGGNMFIPGYDFGCGLVNSAGSSDVFAARLSATTGRCAVAAGGWSFDYGDAGNDQSVNGVAVNRTTVAVFGQFQGNLLTANNTGANIDYIAFGSRATGLTTIKTFDLNEAVNPPAAFGRINAMAGGLVPGTIGADHFAVCGYTSNKVPAALVNDPAAAPGGGTDVVVAVIDNTGSLVWGRQFGGTGDQICNAVAFDDAGNVVITGSHAGVMNIPGATPALGQPSGTNRWTFVAKLDGTTGATLAAVNFGATGTSRSTPRSIAADAAGDVLLAGQFQANVTFPTMPAATALVGTGTSLDTYIAKLSGTTLAPVWARRFGGTGADDARAIGADSAGQVYVAGVFAASATNTWGGPALTATGTATDAFLLRFDPATGVANYAAAYGDLYGQETTTMLVARHATGAERDAIWIHGNYANSITFPGLPVLNAGDATATHKFLVKMK